VEHFEAAALAIVGDGAGDATAVGKQRDDRVLHVDVEPAMHARVLECADEFETCSVADVCKPRVAVPAEVALKDAAVARAI
jgi:hypothetical protein